MGNSNISEIELVNPKDSYAEDESVTINVKFSLQGGIRSSFNEKNWTEAYDQHDTMFKMKYGIKLVSGGLKKQTIGKPIDTYRKASIFWTRNPKLVNPMKERRIWIQVAKNFEPIIKLTEEEIRQELFDFDEPITFKASELGKGNHKIGAEAYASWQKHSFTESDNAKNHAKGIEININ